MFLNINKPRKHITQRKRQTVREALGIGKYYVMVFMAALS